MQEPIRILHVVGAMNRGGAETLLMEIYRHIDRSKVQFDFLVYNYSNQPGAFDKEIKTLGGKIYEAKRKFYKGPFRYISELDEFFSNHQEYRIVHAHQFMMSGYMLRSAKKMNNAITIAHSHIANTFLGNKKGIANKLRKMSDGLGKRLIKNNADYIFGCAEDALKEMTGMNSDGVHRIIMHNAIDSKKFSFSEKKRKEWRTIFDANDDTLIIGNIARFTYQKNHEHILNTFAEICHNKPNSKLVLIGEGDRMAEMKRLAMALGIENNIIFMGSRDNVNEIINAFDVFLMPSRYEGLGIVLIEAQANGLPCVISKDVIPSEADVDVGLITRVSLDSSIEEWARACLNSQKRLEPSIAQQAIKDSGYDIKDVANWLQEFYLSKCK